MTVGTTFPCKILNNGKEPCDPLCRQPGWTGTDGVNRDSGLSVCPGSSPAVPIHPVDGSKLPTICQYIVFPLTDSIVGSVIYLIYLFYLHFIIDMTI